MTYRIIKIGKTAVSVAVCGLMASLPQMAFADTLNRDTATSTTKAADTNSVGVYFNNGNGWADTPAYNVTINLNSGVDLGGETGIGSVPVAIYTFASGNDNYYFTNGAQTSTLNLQGNNQITGLVGVHMDGVGGQVIDPLTQINLNGTDITFNNAVFARQISFTQGGLVQFYGAVGDASAPTSVDYNGNNATVTLHNGVILSGNITNTAKNGALIFTGSGEVTGSVAGSGTAVGVVEVRGNGSLVKIGSDLSTDKLDYQAASTVAVGRDLYLNANTAGSATNAVKFNNTDGVLQVGRDIVGVQDKTVVSTDVNNTGTVTMVSGTQAVLGNLGASGLALKTLNIGGASQGGSNGIDNSDNVASTTTITGHVFAQTISLNNNDATPTSSTLNMASGYNITGNVVTENSGLGNLNLLGGVQTVTGSVGGDGLSGNSPKLNVVTSGADGAASTFTGKVYATTVSNSGTGSSTYQDDVTATTVNVAAGTSNFSKALTATTTNIGAGTGNFSSTSTTTTAIVFTGGNGVANLNNGLTGTVDFGGQANATVNLADGKAISGAITTSTANTGVLNTLGAATLSSDVGTDNAIKALNVNTSASSSKVVLANGNVNAQAVSLQNDGVLRMAGAKNLTGTVSTTAAGTGALDFLGTSVVTGNVGAAGMALKTISGGVTGQTVTFNSGAVYANTLAYTGNGEVRFNGNAPGAGVNDRGFVGAVDFGTNVSSTGTFKLGDAVDLVTQNATGASANTQTTFLDANGATLRFVGNSTVTGNLGSADNAGNQNFAHIFADGASGKVVNFLGKVYVSSSTFNVAGTGTVNFQDDLYGPLRYTADGTVNVADTKSIYPSTDATAAGSVTTTVADTGTLNFLGSTTTHVSIGTSALPLHAVNFHSSTAVPTATVNIGNDVYATTTTIGNATGTTTANITATGKYLGTNLTLSDKTTLNTAGALTTATQSAVNAGTAVSQVDFVHSNYTNGTIAPSAVVTQSTVGAGVIQANNATLNFAVATQPWAAGSNGTGGFVNAAGSSNITGATSLAMGAASTVNVSLLGSLHNGQTATLIDVAGAGDNNVVPGTYRDNSYVIDTQLSRVNGDLVMTAMRDANTYVTKSGTTGHFSNNAAIRLGTLAANGVGYGQDMQTVLNKLDIDQWGYGNNQANLATQVKRLAPIANNSLGLSSLSLGAMAADSIGLRMHELRNVPQKSSYETASFWFKNNYQRGTQSAVGDNDGYTTKLSGVTMGLDSRPDNSSIVGAAFSYGAGSVNQTQFRAGDQANLKSWQLSMYGAYDFTPEFFLGGSLSFAQQNTKGNRATAVGRTALFDFDGTQSAYKVDLGYRIKFEDTTATLTPLVSFEGRTLKQDAYTETNAGDIGLNVAGQRLQSKQAGVGLRLSSTEYMGGMVVKPELMVMSVRDSGHYGDAVASSFIGDATTAASFNTDVASYSPRSTKVSLGVGLLMSKTSALALRYQYLKRDTFSSNMAELLVRWDF